MKGKHPRTDALRNDIGKSGVDWHHSATLMAEHANKLEEELELMQSQRDQVLHLLQGGTLTEAQVIESELGVGVLSEQRHHEAMRCKAEAALKRSLEALAPLVRIADAYDANELDDEARKTWGKDDEHHNDTPPERVGLYSGRGGRQLLTLADCLKARDVLRRLG